MSYHARNKNGLLYPIKHGIGSAPLVFYSTNTLRQRGHGMTGYGMGGLFRAAARRFVPFMKNVLVPFAKKHVVPHAAEALKNVAQDITEGKALKPSIRARSKSALNRGIRSVINQSGTGKRRRTTTKKRKTKGIKLARRRTTRAARS